MKGLLIFILGAIVGAVGLHLYESQDTAPGSTPGTSFADKARLSAADARDSISRKLDEWHLSSDDIKRDLAESGRVVRSKARVAGEKIADARIVTVIKAKYVLDRDLSATAINVDCRDGDVTLTGTASTPDFIARAVALALDTDGVHNVNSRLALPR